MRIGYFGLKLWPLERACQAFNLAVTRRPEQLQRRRMDTFKHKKFDFVFGSRGFEHGD